MKIRDLIFFLTLIKLLTCQQFLSADVVQYINRQIDVLLQRNPPKDVLDLKINAEFNEQRKMLQNAKFKDTDNVTDDAEYQTDQRRRSFSKFVMSFEEVVNQLGTALEEIENVQKNKLIPLSTKYKALTWKNTLQESRTVKEAENNLNRYQDFKRNNLADVNNPYVALAEENRRYFQEILQELKKLSLYENPRVQNGLQNLIENPKKLRNCADALRKLKAKNEDYDVYEIDAWDLFDAFLGL